jgi:zinc protease
MIRFIAPLALALVAFVGGAPAASAMKIEKIVSPGGIEAWLVREQATPLVAVELAFVGGAAQDPADKPGVASLTASLLDEGAGELDSPAFQDRLAEKAIELRFDASGDTLNGSLRTLSENLDPALELLRLAVTAPRFDDEAVERIRQSQLAVLRRRSTDPSSLASLGWSARAFPNHPYGRPVDGTLASVPTITRADLAAFAKRVLAKDNLKIAVVGDITPEALGAALDRVFGALPAKAGLTPVADVAPQGLGTVAVKELAVPQASIVFGGIGLKRDDPDFIPAFVLNHIFGGSAFSSRLFKEVREKRGLAYSIYGALTWMEHSALFIGNTGTRADRAGMTIDAIEKEVARMAETGPTQTELDEAKSYLKGSQMLALDTSSKLASGLLQYQLDRLPIDYLEKRNALVDAVTLEAAKAAAKRLWGNGLITVVVGRAPQAVAQPVAGPVAPATRAD